MFVLACVEWSFACMHSCTYWYNRPVSTLTRCFSMTPHWRPLSRWTPLLMLDSNHITQKNRFVRSHQIMPWFMPQIKSSSLIYLHLRWSPGPYIDKVISLFWFFQCIFDEKIVLLRDISKCEQGIVEWDRSANIRQLIGVVSLHHFVMIK